MQSSPPPSPCLFKHSDALQAALWRLLPRPSEGRWVGWDPLPPPPPRERGGSSAPLAGHWLRQMECLSQHPHMGSGGGQAPRQQGGSSGQPSGRALSKGQHSALLLLRGAPTPPCSSITCLRTGTQLQPLTTASPLMAPAPPLSRAPPSPQTHDHSALEHLASTHWLRYTQPQHASKHTATTGRTP